MHNPTLPDNLIIAILKELWLELSHDRISGKPCTPSNACAFFCPLLLVNKTWHRLALPYSIAYVDKRNVKEVASILKMQPLPSAIRSLIFEPHYHYRPTLTPAEAASTGEEHTAACKRAQRELTEERENWRTVLAGATHVEEVEIGTRAGTAPTAYEDVEAPGRMLLQLFDAGVLSKLRELTVTLLSLALFSDVICIVKNAPHLDTFTLSASVFAVEEYDTLNDLALAGGLPPLRRLSSPSKPRPALSKPWSPSSPQRVAHSLSSSLSILDKNSSASSASPLLSPSSPTSTSKPPTSPLPSDLSSSPLSSPASSYGSTPPPSRLLLLRFVVSTSASVRRGSAAGSTTADSTSS
jgi:hypothetical protein